MASSNNLTSLALTLGVFGDGEEAVDDRKEEGANTTVTEISSEASGPAKSPSDDDGGDKSKKRKKYHRHTAQQIHELEAYVTHSFYYFFYLFIVFFKGN
ncbi:putative transcription regulator Homeodomain-LIKE family [Helianthus annuus]|nr:putative transcription regulator Homeodomain-LIKE family [Helianthus annuus]KAJ0639424.1 putative transcription regulator Homeodomain-LIKE family [Helianthus annuus]KAJ0643410.1 putative transcription regulator Homeodomain-LIKE family [Helianthus annuus]